MSEDRKTISGRTVAKCIFVGAAALGAMVAGTWLSGAAFVVQNKQYGVIPHVRLTSLPKYWDRHGADPVQRPRLVKATAGGYAFALGIVPAAILVSRLRRRRALYGDARFADAAEVEAARLLTGEGIIVGKFQGRYLTFPGQQYVWVAAPPRSGKGRGIAVTNLLNFPGSTIVLDVKGELFDATSGIRAAYGQQVFRFAPFDEETFRTCRYNPLGYIRTDPLRRVADIQEIARIIFPKDGSKGEGDTGNFFADQAFDLFQGLCLYLLETPELPRTLGQMLRLASGHGEPLQKTLADLINDRIKAKRALSSECADALNRVLSSPANTFGGIKSTFTGPLTIFADPLLDAATSTNDFDLRQVRRELMSIYLCIPQRKLAQARLLTTLLLTQAINLNTDKLPEQDTTLKHQCLMLLDEFTVPGRIDVIARTIGLMPGYDMRLLIICQSEAQVAGEYGKETARAMRTAIALQVLFAPKETEDAEAYSKMLGTYTERNVSHSHGTSHGKGGGGSSTGQNEAQASRPLMYPQELRLLDSRKQILMLEGHRPILCDKSYWDQDPALKGRAIPPAKVQPLDVKLHLARVHKQVRPMRPDEGVSEPLPMERLAINTAALPPVKANASPVEVKALVTGMWTAMGGEPLDEGTAKKLRKPRAPKAPAAAPAAALKKGRVGKPAPTLDDVNDAATAAGGSAYDDELPADFGMPPAAGSSHPYHP
ncbi:type IV secretory system conjugative DNA transfer family protein [uncultured Azohydromonas sp.]|jgi:Type IV secretory pathway, VirD4 components|uniref:type IV secretory system conjugative DNA transfer family protein n=1 Tax=uncultured Azohydromonas sp. TaxID=487342 RepID=UPI002625B951|nr:type IV secretory system conjugative DNA transfer family protein [uncultured Azohydromonas sp.]